MGSVSAPLPRFALGWAADNPVLVMISRKQSSANRDPLHATLAYETSRCSGSMEIEIYPRGSLFSSSDSSWNSSLYSSVA